MTAFCISGLLCAQVMEAFSKAEKRKKPNPDFLFTDVYDTIPVHLKKQHQEMREHVNQYKEHYPLNNHESMS